jgi:hypothetical protein
MIVGSQTASRKDPGTRYHVAHADHDHDRDSGSRRRYFYEEQDIPSHPAAQSGLVRIAVAKVTDECRLQSLLRDIPVQENDSAFNCLSWVREAYFRLLEDGRSVKSYLKPEDWSGVETCARKYCKGKRDAGRFNDGPLHHDNVRWDVEKISTFNFWENRETTM